mmetsp:Transcript_11350/g.24048  ORF Transcript_11350/g.24048 Transcript_11350/m.24048 type:complete len:191 (-) Transcript_11350:64-636(-)
MDRHSPHGSSNAASDRAIRQKPLPLCKREQIRNGYWKGLQREEPPYKFGGDAWENTCYRTKGSREGQLESRTETGGIPLVGFSKPKLTRRKHDTTPNRGESSVSNIHHRLLRHGHSAPGQSHREWRLPPLVFAGSHRRRERGASARNGGCRIAVVLLLWFSLNRNSIVPNDRISIKFGKHPRTEITHHVN